MARTASSEDSPRTLYADQRHQRILHALRVSGRVDVTDLATDLKVTGETVRKDLIQLERNGLLRRVHGGAVPVEQLLLEPAVAARTQFEAQKARIARAALRHVPAGGSVLLDAGSTTAQLADLLPPEMALTVYTNALPIALGLVSRPRVTVYTLGGRLRGPTQAEVDDWAVRALHEINVDVAFLGTNGLSIQRGLTTPDPAEAAVKRAMLACTRRRVLLADHSKVGQVRGRRHGTLADVDLLITDSDIPTPDLDALRATGLSVECA